MRAYRALAEHFEGTRDFSTSIHFHQKGLEVHLPSFVFLSFSFLFLLLLSSPFHSLYFIYLFIYFCAILGLVSTWRFYARSGFVSTHGRRLRGTGKYPPGHSVLRQVCRYRAARCEGQGCNRYVGGEGEEGGRVRRTTESKRWRGKGERRGGEEGKRGGCKIEG